MVGVGEENMRLSIFKSKGGSQDMSYVDRTEICYRQLLSLNTRWVSSCSITKMYKKPLLPYLVF